MTDAGLRALTFVTGASTCLLAVAVPVLLVVCPRWAGLLALLLLGLASVSFMALCHELEGRDGRR